MIERAEVVYTVLYRCVCLGFPVFVVSGLPHVVQCITLLRASRAVWNARARVLNGQCTTDMYVGHLPAETPLFVCVNCSTTHAQTLLNVCRGTHSHVVARREGGTRYGYLIQSCCPKTLVNLPVLSLFLLLRVDGILTANRCCIGYT